MKSPAKNPKKSNMVSPRSAKPSLLKNQIPLNKFKVIKECSEQNPEIDYKQQSAILKKYVTELETMVSEHNIEYLYMKGLMEMEHKRALELETKNNLDTKSWQERIAVKQKQEQEKIKQIFYLKGEIEGYISKIDQLTYKYQTLHGEKRLKQNQLEEYKYKIKNILREKDQYIENVERKQNERIREIQSMKQLEKKTKDINRFSKQQFFIIGKMEQLSYLIHKQTSQQFIVEDTKRIQTLQNRIRLNSLEYENQLIKLKNQIKKINQCYKQQMVAKQKQIKAEMLTKYQSKINLIPNLKNDIKRLEEKIAEKDRILEEFQKRELMYKIMELGKVERAVFYNDKIINSEFSEENGNQQNQQTM